MHCYVDYNRMISVYPITMVGARRPDHNSHRPYQIKFSLSGHPLVLIYTTRVATSWCIVDHGILFNFLSGIGI